MTSRFCNRVHQAKAGTVSAIALMALTFALPALHPAEAQDFTLLHTFTGGADGAYSRGPLIEGPDNEIYGAATAGGKYNYGNVFKMTKNGAHETILNSFRYWNGNDPDSYLTLDFSGVIYGAAFEGGDDGDNGTFYELNGRKEKVIHQFPYLVSSDGYNPNGPMVVDAQGNFYGATRNGGTTNNGTIFKIDPSGNETVLYNFAGQADGSLPLGLVMGPDGDLYGATSCTYTCYSGGGTIFKMDTAGNLTTIYSFTGGADGNVPNGYLLFDDQGNIYGAANLGGTGPCNEDGYAGCGTIFELTPGGTESVLYDFQGSTDGAYPSSGVITDAKGDFYGVTLAGGDLNINDGGCGVVYELNPKGKETVLHTFDATDGCEPEGELLLSKKVLYGVTYVGTSTTYGGVFKIAPK